MMPNATYSNTQQDHTYIQSCLCILIQNTIFNLKTHFSSKSILKCISLRTVSHQIAHRLATKTLSKLKIIQDACCKLYHDIRYYNCTTINRQMFYKHMIGIQNLRSGKWLIKENLVANYVTFFGFVLLCIWWNNCFECLGISYKVNINWKYWVF
jgi:hypothetical protein